MTAVSFLLELGGAKIPMTAVSFLLELGGAKIPMTTRELPWTPQPQILFYSNWAEPRFG
jgi:hypothetical protein